MDKLDIKVEEAVNRILDSDITAYRIWQDSGIQKSQITRLRSGERSLDNSEWSTIKKLYNYSVKHVK